MLGRAVLQARTSTQSTRRAIWSFRRFVSTTPPVCSTPATATNRVCIRLNPVRRLTYAQVRRQRSRASGKPSTSKREEALLLSRLTLALLRRLPESLYCCPVQNPLLPHSS